jgi:hypothetical protein
VVRVLREDPILEAADDVLIGDVGVHLEETLGVGPQGHVHLLLDLGQIVASAYSDQGTQESMEFGLRLSSQVRGVDSKAAGK